MKIHKLKRWLGYNLLYLGDPPWDTGVSPPELKDYLRHASPGRALDVGCGTGTNLLTMAKMGWQVVGVDIAWLSVIQARRKLRQAGEEGRVIYGDITGDLKLTGAFDLVLDIGCYHSLSAQGREDYRQNLHGWLKPGGTYLLYAHRRTSHEASHGIAEADMDALEQFLELDWRDDGAEERPDGGGGRPSTWAQFKQKSEVKR